MVIERESAEGLRAQIAQHEPGDFSLDVFWWRLCDYCEADPGSALRQATWVCQKSGLALCVECLQTVVDGRG